MNKNIKQQLLGAVAVMVMILSFGSCKEEYITYNGQAFVLFSDTLSVCPVMVDDKEFPIQVVTTKAVDYDRTYAIEIVPQNSTAVLERHFTLATSTVTIKGGTTVGVVNLKPIYANIEREDTLKVELRLVSQLKDEWSSEASTTKIQFDKVCPFDINNFTGSCYVYSAFLSSIIPSVSNRVVKCELVEGEENTIIMRGLFATGYDIKMKFDATDPLNIKMNIVGEQLVGLSPELLGATFTENRLRISDAPGYQPIVATCYGEALQYIKMKIGPYVNIYPTLYQWVEDWEVE